jgi:hypothetical protein
MLYTLNVLSLRGNEARDKSLPHSSRHVHSNCVHGWVVERQGGRKTHGKDAREVIGQLQSAQSVVA